MFWSLNFVCLLCVVYNSAALFCFWLMKWYEMCLEMSERVAEQQCRILHQIMYARDTIIHLISGRRTLAGALAACTALFLLRQTDSRVNVCQGISSYESFICVISTDIFYFYSLFLVHSHGDYNYWFIYTRMGNYRRIKYIPNDWQNFRVKQIRHRVFG